MPTFARIVRFATKTAFDDKGDSIKLSNILSFLQSKGASIKSITQELSYVEHHQSTIVLYLIQYEAPTYIDV